MGRKKKLYRLKAFKRQYRAGLILISIQENKLFFHKRKIYNWGNMKTRQLMILRDYVLVLVLLEGKDNGTLGGKKGKERKGKA